MSLEYYRRRVQFKPFTLDRFVTESNRIERLGPAKSHEIEAHERLLSAPVVTVEVLTDFVAAVAPGAELRDKLEMNVYVGGHRPPPGGPHIRDSLRILLDAPLGAFAHHVAYETLHPFMDGNGRSGRALWLRKMGGLEYVPLGFLHTFYYQALDYSRRGRETYFIHAD